jgi:hypothetical protein
MFSFLRSHPYRSAGAAVGVLAGLAWVAFGYFGVHTLFFDDVVSEAAPVFDAPAAATVAPTPADPNPAAAPADPPDSATDATSAPTAPAPAAPAPTATPAVPEIVAEYDGDFVDESRYTTSGQAVVLGNGTGQRFLRFEEFATDNGPDLNVYLVNSSTGDVSDYIDLGDLRGNIGEQNYEIPTDVDLEVYDQVVIWCVRFGVAFGSASLAMV